MTSTFEKVQRPRFDAKLELKILGAETGECFVARMQKIEFPIEGGWIRIIVFRGPFRV